MHSAPDTQVLNFKSAVGLTLVAVLALVFLAGQLDLLFGIEHQHQGTFTRAQPDRAARYFTLEFETDEGPVYARRIHSLALGHLGLRAGDEVALKTDGLLWRRVVAIDKGEGFRALP